MELVRKVLLLVVICEIIISSEQNLIENITKLEKPTSKLYNVLAKLLKNCEKNYETIMIFVDLEVVNLKWMQELHTDASIILHQNLSKDLQEYNRIKKLDAYVLIISSLTSIKSIYWYLRNNILWWDALVPAYILYTEIYDCISSDSESDEIKFPESVFLRLNRYGVVTSYVICSDIQQEIKLYTYNIFGDRAPSQWKRVEKMFKEHHWAMYERNFIEDEICDELYFDRTDQPDGFELIIASSPEFADLSLIGEFYNQSIIYDFPEYLDRYQRLYIDALSTALNVQCTIYFNAPRSPDKMVWYEWPNYIIDVWINSSCDLFLTPEILSQDIPIFIFKESYPLPITEYGIITHHRGYKTFVEKIRDFYGIWIILFTVFVLLVVFIVIWFTENKKTFFTISEIIRLLIGQSLITRMNSLSLRIFFSVILIYFLVIQATFNGHLAKFLTKPELRKHADSFDDLQDLGYTAVYNTSTMIDNLAETPEEGASISALTETCIKYILSNDSSAACVSTYRHLNQFFIGNEENLYLGKPFNSYYVQYMIRRECPLVNRINLFFITTEDLGIGKFINRDWFSHNSSSLDFKRIQAKFDEDFRPIKLKDLTPFVITLGIGLGGATIIFSIEMIIFYQKKYELRLENF